MHTIQQLLCHDDLIMKVVNPFLFDWGRLIMKVDLSDFYMYFLMSTVDRGYMLLM